MLDIGDTRMELQLFKKQQLFANAVLSGKFNYLLYGGAIRGGKSVLVIAIICILARIYPGSRWAITRKDLPTLRRNTIPTFEFVRSHIDQFVGEVNKSTWTAKCANGSEILFFPESVKDDPELNRWRGLEVNGFVLEEANELTEGAFNKAIERAGSWRCKAKEQPNPLVLLTCNPAKNYVKRRFYDPWKAGRLEAPYFYMPAYITDNPHIPPKYLQSIENLPPADFQRFVKGDWDSADDPDQLIQFEWILEAMNRDPVRGKRALGVDVARFGNDDTVIAYREGHALIDMEYHSGLSIDRTADIVQTRINEGSVDANEVRIDTVGLGAGVADNLKRNGFDVSEIVSGTRAIERPDSFYKFFNLRSQMWWEYREGLRDGHYSIGFDDARLNEDLTAPRYSVSGDRVLRVESKEDIKRRIGRSTDAGDAAVYAFIDLPAEVPVVKPAFV